MTAILLALVLAFTGSAPTTQGGRDKERPILR